MRVCVASHKGGVGKTKTAIHLALGLSRTGRTLLVDADPGQQATAYNHSLAAGMNWPRDRCAVISAGTSDFVRRVTPQLGEYDHLVIDVSPKNTLLIRQAMGLCDGVIVPARPTTEELMEVAPTFAVAAEVDKTHPLWAAVLLVQVRSGMTAGADAREMLMKYDLPAFDAQVRMLKRYEQAFGTVPLDDLGDYEAVLTELMQEEITT